MDETSRPGPRLRPAHRRRVTVADVGRRVSVRHWIDDPDRGRIPTDVVGHLRAWEDGALRIERRDGRRVHVPEDAVVASRVVPDVSGSARG